MLRLSEVPHERPVSLREAAERVREFTGKRPHAATLYRWVSRGVRGVTLETLVVAGSRVTTMAAIERFIAATTAAANERLKSKGGAT
jgi:hypothetical protein